MRKIDKNLYLPEDVVNALEQSDEGASATVTRLVREEYDL